jgi:protein gp37
VFESCHCYSKVSGAVKKCNKFITLDGTEHCYYREGEMSENSSIEWTDATWNPVRGCTKISPGCKHCYAETFAERFRGVAGHPYEKGFDLRLVPEKLLEPLQWSRPKRVFVNSMSDLFHERVPERYIFAVSQVMCESPWHIYQVLTKRSPRLKELLASHLARAARQPNIWWGVSIEDKKYGFPRLEDLKDSPAAVRFLSIEPLLEDLGELDLRGIHWVIVGGESGPGARPIEESWILSIMEQCKVAKVPFFFKQWVGVQKSRTGRLLQGRAYDEFPKGIAPPIPSRIQRNIQTAQLAQEFSDFFGLQESTTELPLLQ